ncbi:SlyX protein [Nitrincola tibetensis]|uniref:SlyX protein n=1 Tax=Nitrincola tibetensis TaxID=2219697 RepID=A0A364NL33_9GAMM|nr:SlyX family protein [Nitrincola tibetensis]RAU17806.1 SlyX protein [Nitrincola tibetensis]
MSELTRMQDLESRVAFQEDAIDQLSSIIARQEKEIERLTHSLIHLNNRLNELTVGEEPFVDQLPPHY